MLYLIAAVEKKEGNGLALIQITEENRQKLGMVHIDTIIEATDQEDAKKKAEVRIQEINAKIAADMAEMKRQQQQQPILVPAGMGGIVGADGIPISSGAPQRKEVDLKGAAAPVNKEPELPN